MRNFSAKYEMNAKERKQFSHACTFPPFVNARAGFTMVELVVSISVFIMLTAIATGGFVIAMRSQRQVIGLLAASSNASLVLEQIAREARTGYNFCRPAAVPSTACTGAGPDYSNLVFMNANNERISYGLVNGAVQRSVNAGAAQNLTAGTVNVTRATFRVVGNVSPDGGTPRITTFLGVAPREASVAASPIDFQTTVSARTPDE